MPTLKLVSIILEPSSGSNATENLPPGVMGFSTGTSSEDAVATTPDAVKLSKMTLSASTSMASCSSPKSLKQDILSQDAVRILYAISLHAAKIPRVHDPKSRSTRESQSSNGSPVAIIFGGTAAWRGAEGRLAARLTRLVPLCGGREVRALPKKARVCSGGAERNAVILTRGDGTAIRNRNEAAVARCWTRLDERRWAGVAVRMSGEARLRWGLVRPVKRRARGHVCGVQNKLIAVRKSTPNRGSSCEKIVFAVSNQQRRVAEFGTAELLREAE